MRFQPLSDEELKKQRGTLSSGKADFQIIAASEETSKAGNPMLKLQLKVWDCEGREGLVFDYITNNAQWKIKHLLASIGEPEKYETGQLQCDDLLNKQGKAEIRIERDKTGKYGDQAKIKDYIFSTDGQTFVTGAASDDVPF